MKINSPIYLSIVALAALGLGMQSASAADNESSEVKPAPRVINVNAAAIRRADSGCSGCSNCASNRGNRSGRRIGGHGSDCGSCDCGSCYGGQGSHGVAGLGSAMHSGQPLFDPYARGDWRAAQEAATRSWHAGYYSTQWGEPVALMVPPTARTQTRWGWGVSQSTTSPIYHQYKRPYPGPAYGGYGETGAGTGGLLPTPRWPSHTDQFGVYYVRGPW